MKLRNVLPAMALLAAAAAAMAADLGQLESLPNARFPEENRIVSGALAPQDVRRLADAGVRHVVDLQPSQEHTFDEEQLLHAKGVQYHPIPISGAAALTRENAAKLDAVLEKIGPEPALLHCSSGNRVGALIAVRAAWIQGASPDQAIEEGERWGLKALKPAVRALLLPEASAETSSETQKH
ncbi:MAG: tyrosine-protein phosphatase [Steroidobacteraceae bacterium]|jgi:uncharacterized protein (TIGR01244 family)|nr:tyrosine-protein phosphatase [Steroidobacteraceae bacterium]